jgi:uncharacterized protein YuzE
MTGVSVSIAPPTEGGRLHPRYDAESDILTVTSETPRDWPHGVDIDGNVVFDLDAKRNLANFDIHVGRRLWERGPVRRWPDKAAVGTIVFSKETIEQKSLNMPLRLVYDDEQGILNVVLGARQPDRELELSKECVALLSGNELVGFLLRKF